MYNSKGEERKYLFMKPHIYKENDKWKVIPGDILPTTLLKQEFITTEYLKFLLHYDKAVAWCLSKNFHASIKLATEIVKTWPDWKRNYSITKYSGEGD